MKPANKISRRSMIGTAASMSLAAPVARAAEASEPSKKKPAASNPSPLPTRKLGRNGPEVSILAVGGQAEATSVEYYENVWNAGIRYFDMADCYRGGKSEKALGAWLREHPERRKEVFIVDKDHPKQIADIPAMLDKRLDILGTDYLDMFLIHGLGAREYGEECYDWPKSPEYKKMCERMKKSGKTNLMGFSCHDMQNERFLHAAAEGGFVDAILTPASPFHAKGDGIDRAFDACHKAGIGLINMKVMRNAKNVPKRLPEFDKLGLTTHQGVLHALWSDERVTAGCIWMANDEELASNSEAARLYREPLQIADLKVLRDCVLASGAAMCPGCASCLAHAAQHGTDLKSISRFVAYYEQDGTQEAARLYQAMRPSERNVEGVDLEAMREACDYHVNYPEIVKRAKRYFA